MRNIGDRGGSEDARRISQSMGLLLVSRLMLAGAVVLAGSMFLRQGATSLSLLYVAAAVLVLTILYMSLLRRSHPALPLLHLQIGADLIIVTWVVAITGRGESPFVLLYFISIILAGYFLLFRGGLFAAAGASIGYLAASLGPGLWARSSMSPAEVFQCTVNVAFFLVVGMLSGYLGRNTRRQELSLERARKELNRVRLDTDCIIRNMGSGLLTVDASHKVSHFNPAAASILGLDARLMKGADLSVLDRLGMGAIAEIIRKTIAGGREIPRREIDVPLSQGRVVPLGVSTSVVRDEGGAVNGAVAVFQDLTEAREMERRARSNETLAAIGQLASAVAHEIRNCLSPISGSVEVLAEQLQVDGENRQLLDLIYRESRHLEEFTSALLDFAKVRPLSLEEVDVSSLLEETLETVKRHPSFDHELSLNVPAEGSALCVMADRSQLRNAFMNLGINAVEATPRGGAISVNAEYLGATGSSGNGTVIVEFTDSGGGIDEADRERVFEPFFTTKKKGSGLGLALVRQIAARHGGGVSLKSTSGAGTTVRIELPCQAQAMPQAA